MIFLNSRNILKNMWLLSLVQEKWGENLCTSGSGTILIINARLICLPPRAIDILLLGCCLDLSAICININNSLSHLSFLSVCQNGCL